MIAVCLEIRDGKIKRKPIQLLNTNITPKRQYKILYHRLFDILLVQEIILSYKKSVHSL
jgi:hypothetical protein